MLRSDFEMIIDLPISETHKLVMLILLRYRNGHSGQCNPSKKLIAEKLGRCERVAYSTLRELRLAGHIDVAELGGGAGQKTSYVLTLPAKTLQPDSVNLAATLQLAAKNPAAGFNRKTNKELNTLKPEHGGAKAPQRETRRTERSLFARAIANGRG